MSAIAVKNRVTTNPSQVFAACSDLAIRQEDMNKQSMTEISGGNPFLLGIIGGIVVVAATNPQGVVDAIDWYGDRASEAYSTIKARVCTTIAKIS